MSGDPADPGIVPIPEKVANSALEAHPWKDIRRAKIVVN